MAQVEDSGSIVLVLLLVVVALGAGGAVFYMKQKQGPPPPKPELSKEVPVWRQNQNANSPQAPAPSKRPDPVQSQPSANSAPPKPGSTGISSNAAANARAQIKAQISSGQKLTTDAAHGAEPVPVPVAKADTGPTLSAAEVIHEAQHLRESQHGDLAIQKLRAYLDRTPGEPAVLELLGDVYLDRHDFSHAEAVYRESAHSHPSANVYDKLGKVYEALGDMPSAISAYRSATIADPHDYKAFNNLGGLLAESGDIAGGVSAFKRAVELNPADQSLKDNLAIAMEMLASNEGAPA